MHFNTINISFEHLQNVLVSFLSCRIFRIRVHDTIVFFIFISFANRCFPEKPFKANVVIISPNYFRDKF